MPIIGIHLDLKYTMPRKAYLLEWVQRLPQLGINTILLEYEDKFPFEKYPFLRAEGHFRPEELRQFLAVARGAGLRIIPLVQTLSHLEFALAHEALADLREAPDIPTQICPTNPEAIRFVKDLLTEVMSYHEPDELFHIGADEAWFLGTCPKCAARMQADPIRLWLEHTSEMCRFVMEQGKRPLVWDDTFWKNADAVRALPRETVLVSWDYSRTTAEESKFPWKNVRAYRDGGYDVMGAPCLNWGVLVPEPRRVLNTAAWAQIARQTSCLGILNTAWASFHVPLASHWMQVAATGALMAGSAETIGLDWEQAFFEREFGVRMDGLAEAYRVLGAIWEVPIQGLARPITPVVYGYMDMVLHYRGGQEERRKRGAYPLDWSEVDFDALYRRKIELLRASPDSAAILTRVDELLGAYAQAREVFAALAGTATTRREEADLLYRFADLKWVHARVLGHMLRGDGREGELRSALSAQKAPLARRLSTFLEPVSVERMLRIWWRWGHTYELEI